jgi:hypothetical protein
VLTHKIVGQAAVSYFDLAFTSHGAARLLGSRAICGTTNPRQTAITIRTVCPQEVLISTISA